MLEIQTRDFGKQELIGNQDNDSDDQLLLETQAKDSNDRPAKFITQMKNILKARDLKIYIFFSIVVFFLFFFNK